MVASFAGRARLVALGASALVAIAGGLALAQRFRVHEMVPYLAAGDASSLVSGRGAEPAAIVYDGHILRAPAGGPLTQEERPIEAEPSAHASGGAVSQPTFHPDRETALHGSVSYYEVFVPSVAPYKRLTSLDVVRLDEHGVPYLTVDDTARTVVPVEGVGAPAPDGRARDRFWGSVVLDFRRGDEVPFPSVSPESRIVSLRTEPAVPLQIERDGSGNFFATIPSGETAREVRVVFLTDAPRTFFGFEPGRRWPDVRADALSEQVRPMPPSVMRQAQSFATELGLSREMPFGQVLETLVRHFRSFEESDEPPPSTGNVYLDLARGMRGVCRHRAYAFVVTASALGIVSRFVSNEAHAWVEVLVPEHGGWLRIDLGGSAQGLVPRNVSNAPLYDPRLEDPFPRPPAFERAFALAAARERSLRPERSPWSAPGTTGAPPNGDSDPTSAFGANSGASSPATTDSTTSRTATRPPATTRDRIRTAGSRAPLSIEVVEHTGEVLRGRTIDVAGIATSAGAPASHVRVEVSLRAPSGQEHRLGATVSDEDGNFHASFGVPPDMAVGDYRLVVRSPGDARFRPWPDGA